MRVRGLGFQFDHVQPEVDKLLESQGSRLRAESQDGQYRPSCGPNRLAFFRPFLFTSVERWRPPLSSGIGGANQLQACIHGLTAHFDHVRPEIDKSFELERSRFTAQRDDNFGLVLIQLGERDR